MAAINLEKYRQWHSRLQQPGWFRWFWLWWGLYGIVLYGALGADVLFRTGQGLKIDVLVTIAGLINVFVICKIIHLFHRKPHPYQTLGFRPPWSWLLSLTDETRDAFPSEHVSTTAAISTVLYLYFPILGVLGFIIVAFTAAGRIVLAYHDLADVLVGLIVGVGSGLLVYYLLAARIMGLPI